MKRYAFLFLGLTINLFANIQLNTTERAPFIKKSNDKITGVATEIVEELFKRAKVEYIISEATWNLSYNKAKDLKENAVFPTTRTDAKEKLFKWVGPITKESWVLMARKYSPVLVNSLEDARRYRVGTEKSTAISEFLKAKGHYLTETKNANFSAIKLDRGQIDLWATTNFYGQYIAKKNNISGLEVLHEFDSRELNIAFNIKTDDKLIQTLMTELKKMYADGTIEAIEQKYK